MIRARHVLPSLLLALGSLALCGLALEVAARAAARAREDRAHRVQDRYARYHPTLGWEKRPGTSAWVRRPEYEARMQVNSRGLRGPERGYVKPPGVRRLLLLGDSFVEGYTVREEATVSARLEELLNGRPGPRHEVLNGGTRGYSTDQEYLFFAAEGHRYQPDEVVLLFYYNDLFGNTAADARKPHFELEGGRLALRNSPSPLVPAVGAAGFPAPDRDVRVRPWRGSVALGLLSDRTRSSNPKLHGWLGRLGLVEVYPREPVPPEFVPFGPPQGGEPAGIWARTAALLRELKAEVEARRARLIVFYVPARFEVYPRAWETTRARYALGPDWKPERVAETLTAVCRSAGLPLIDPRSAFRASASRGAALYFKLDAHWTEDGHALAAREIAAFLVR